MAALLQRSPVTVSRLFLRICVEVTLRIGVYWVQECCLWKIEGRSRGLTLGLHLVQNVLTGVLRVDLQMWCLWPHMHENTLTSDTDCWRRRRNSHLRDWFRFSKIAFADAPIKRRYQTISAKRGSSRSPALSGTFHMSLSDTGLTISISKLRRSRRQSKVALLKNYGCRSISTAGRLYIMSKTSPMSK